MKAVSKKRLKNSKGATGINIPQEERGMLEALKSKYPVLNRTQIILTAIRELARKEGIAA